MSVDDCDDGSQSRSWMRICNLRFWKVFGAMVVGTTSSIRLH